MVYKATTQRTFLLFLLILVASQFFINRNYPEVYYFLIPLSIFTLATIFMKFKLKIGDDSLTFQILVFNLTIYKKEVHYNQIIRMKFKRTGWAKKCVNVQNKMGFNFRITNFNSENIYHDLIDFADKHKIPVSKTKDYLILEKLK